MVCGLYCTVVWEMGVVVVVLVCAGERYVPRIGKQVWKRVTVRIHGLIEDG